MTPPTGTIQDLRLGLSSFLLNKDILTTSPNTELTTYQWKRELLTMLRFNTQLTMCQSADLKREPSMFQSTDMIIKLTTTQSKEAESLETSEIGLQLPQD